MDHQDKDAYEFTIIGHSNSVLSNLRNGFRTGLYNSTLIGNHNGIITANHSILMMNGAISAQGGVNLKKKDGVDNQYYFKDVSYNSANLNITFDEKDLIRDLPLEWLKRLFDHAVFNNRFKELYISEVTLDTVDDKKKILFTTSKPLENYFRDLDNLTIIPQLPYNNTVNVGSCNFVTVATHGSSAVTYGIANISMTETFSVTHGISNITRNSHEVAIGILNLSIPGVSIFTIGVGDIFKGTRKNAYMYTGDGKHYFAGIGGYEGTEYSMNKSIKDLKTVLDSKADIQSIPDVSNLATKEELHQKIQELNNTIGDLTKRIIALEQKP